MYLDIADHAVIANARTAALVGRNGTIDWCCLPYFHSPSVFGALLDDESGGRFTVTLPDGSTTEQQYEAETNVLRTRMESAAGTVRVVDFMPTYMEQGELIDADEVIRAVQCLDGQPTVGVDFDPRLDYGRGETDVDIVTAGCRATNDEAGVSLSAPLPLDHADAGVSGRYTLGDGEAFTLVCRYGDTDPGTLATTDVRQKLQRTRDYWRQWSRRCEYDGRWSDVVQRSALALKALTYEETDAIVAAATTSLPEKLGGTRNWDYRFAWIRDTVFSAWSLYQLDYHELGIQFLHLLVEKLDPEEIPPLVNVAGDPVQTEEELDHLDGFRGTGPVRIGNAADEQEQWDSYGAMVDGAYFSHRKLGGIDTEIYEEFVKPAVDHICSVWDEPDHGIWEVRGEKRHFTNSKVWCWVVLDRGIKIANEQGFREDIDRWEPIRTEIREDILENGWSEELGAFKIAYGTDALDAATLLIPLVGFLPADHPKMEQTIDAIQDDLATGPLVYRYRPEEVGSDPIESEEAVFTTCSFWLIACLARLGRVEEARDQFETLLEYANHVGLYSEELDPDSGIHLGNFPQAYVHMGVINAAIELNRVLDDGAL